MIRLMLKLFEPIVKRLYPHLVRKAIKDAMEIQRTELASTVKELTEGNDISVVIMVNPMLAEGLYEALILMSPEEEEKSKPKFKVIKNDE